MTDDIHEWAERHGLFRRPPQRWWRRAVPALGTRIACACLAVRQAVRSLAPERRCRACGHLNAQHRGYGLCETCAESGGACE